MAENKLLLSRAKTAVLSRDYDFAARLYKQMLGESPENESLLLELGSVYSKGGKDASALSVYQKINQINPDNTEALMAMSAIYRRTRNYDQSVAMLEKARSIDANNMQIVYNLGFTYKSMGKYDEAIACFEDVIDQNPSDVLAYNHIGSIYAEQGDHETAISSYLRALKVDSNHPVIQLNLAKSYEAMGETEKALSAYENSLRAKPGWLEAVGAYSDLLLKNDHVHEAYAVLRNAVAINPKDARIHTQLGHVYYRQSIFEDAQKEYQTALSCDSDYDPALVGLADTQENLNEHAEAAKTIRRAEQIRPDDPAITQKAAHIMLSANEYADAFERISRLREQNPDDVQALSLLGQYYICNGEWDKVEECYAKIAEYDPTYSAHYRDGAKRFRQKGDDANAEKYLRMAIEKNPRDVTAMNNLAELLEKAKRGKEAFELYKQASDTDSLNAASKKAANRLETAFGYVEISEYKPPEATAGGSAGPAATITVSAPAGVVVAPVVAGGRKPSLMDALFDEDWVDIPNSGSLVMGDGVVRLAVGQQAGGDVFSDDVIVPPDDDDDSRKNFRRPLSVAEQTVFDASSLQGLVMDDDSDDISNLFGKKEAAESGLEETAQLASESAKKAEYAAQQAWEAAQIAADSAQALGAMRQQAAVQQASEPLPAEPQPPAQQSESAPLPAALEPEEEPPVAEPEAAAESPTAGLPESSTPLDVFLRLRELCEYLPPDRYDEFMSSRTRLLMEYVIARLSGEAGLLQKALTCRQEHPENLPSAEALQEAEAEEGIQLVTRVVDDVLTLIQDVPEKNLRSAMEATTKALVEKLIS